MGIPTKQTSSISVAIQLGNQLLGKDVTLQSQTHAQYRTHHEGVRARFFAFFLQISVLICHANKAF